MNKLSKEELEGIRERERRATPGPWIAAFNGAMRGSWAIQTAGSSNVVVHLEPVKNIDLDQATHRVDSDLDFLQAARTDIPALLETIEALQTPEGSPSGSADGTQELQLALVEMAQQNEQLRAALEFYANARSYRKPADPPAEPHPWVGTDLGRRARQALGIAEPIKE